MQLEIRKTSVQFPLSIVLLTHFESNKKTAPSLTQNLTTNLDIGRVSDAELKYIFHF